MLMWVLNVRRYVTITQVAKINAAGAKVLYMGTKPEPGTTSLHTTYAAYDAMIAAAAESNADLYMVDVTSEFKALGNPASLYQSDDLHLSEEGYVLWTKWVRSNANNAVPYHQNMLEATDEIIVDNVLSVYNI